MFAVVTAVLAASCEPWCSNACGELNGNVAIECAGCGSSSKCRPGAPGFDTTGDNKPTQRVEVAAAGDQGNYAEKYSSHGNPMKEPTSFIDDFVVGACDLDSVDHNDVTREMLMRATKPFLIKGLTANWSAHETWGKTEFLRRHATEPFQLHAKGHAALGDLLKINGKYHMGHAIYPPGGCYADPWRPYSPMLFGALKEDYYLPRYLGPMVTFQMGVGSGFGIGVPPENHPSSWFAMVKGRKRWVLRPPDAGTSRSGAPGTEPPGVMQRWGEQLCAPENKPTDALHCDQLEGDVIWVPDYWWHETCGLEDFSIGLGALTYDGCCPAERLEMVEKCIDGQGGESGDSYNVYDIPSCTAGDRSCGGLPFSSHQGLS